MSSSSCTCIEVSATLSAKFSQYKVHYMIVSYGGGKSMTPPRLCWLLYDPNQDCPSPAYKNIQTEYFHQDFEDVLLKNITSSSESIENTRQPITYLNVRQVYL
ncbi:hypothetical protein TNCT_565451 [Trichonephila clavata]|uniref:Uncharacterized protein n=1 Tax=Trichonephila clavata TaxID=2740835 RepID=A0A8X6L7Q5_TRICU|nr:hypothetical protein TNCT_565451 [Trichonephila clavata]